MSNIVVTIPVNVSFNPKAYMIRDQIIAKMFEMEIKDFSDDELHRVFNDCVAKNRLFLLARELIELCGLTMEEVYTPIPQNQCTQKYHFYVEDVCAHCGRYKYFQLPLLEQQKHG